MIRFFSRFLWFVVVVYWFYYLLLCCGRKVSSFCSSLSLYLSRFVFVCVSYSFFLFIYFVLVYDLFGRSWFLIRNVTTIFSLFKYYDVDLDWIELLCSSCLLIYWITSAAWEMKKKTIAKKWVLIWVFLSRSLFRFRLVHSVFTGNRWICFDWYILFGLFDFDTAWILLQEMDCGIFRFFFWRSTIACINVFVCVWARRVIPGWPDRSSTHCFKYAKYLLILSLKWREVKHILVVKKCGQNTQELAEAHITFVRFKSISQP